MSRLSVNLKETMTRVFSVIHIPCLATDGNINSFISFIQ